MYYIGLDVHKKTISYCVKAASGQIHQEGKVGAAGYTRHLPPPGLCAVMGLVIFVVMGVSLIVSIGFGLVETMDHRWQARAPCGFRDS